MFKQIAGGTTSDIGQLGNFDSQFKEGQRGYLELTLLFIPPGMDTLLDGLDWSLRQAGAKLYKPSEVLEGRRVHIYFQRAFPPLILIAAALVGLWLIVLASWKLFREEAKELSKFILIVVGIIVIGLVLVATKGKLAAPGIEVGG